MVLIPHTYNYTTLESAREVAERIHIHIQHGLSGSEVGSIEDLYIRELAIKLIAILEANSPHLTA